MNLNNTVELYGGGPGSGCRGDNCGRPAGPGHLEDHSKGSDHVRVPKEAHDALIGKGFTYRSDRKGSGNSKQAVYVSSDDKHEVWVDRKGNWTHWTGLPGKMKTVLVRGGKLWNINDLRI